MRCIDADRLLTDRMKSKYYHLPNGDIAIPLIDIEQAPTIELVRKGYWMEDDNEMRVACSECGEPNDSMSDYCPNCGAKMEEGEQE